MEKRIASIDIFRSLTMILMVFVNDLWTISDYPQWLGHAAATEDRLGFSDVIFPAFLFIVGLSIPHALDDRASKGQNLPEVLWHIVTRTLALLVMGFYMVNFENINREVLPISPWIWEIVMAAAIFLVWTDYSGWTRIAFKYTRALQFLGIILFLLLSLLYRNSAGDTGMSPHWWGILGLIGWSYLIISIAYLLTGGNFYGFLTIWLIALVLNVFEFAGPAMGWTVPKLIVSASNYSLVASGTLATLLLRKAGSRGYLWIFVMAVVLLAVGVLIRPLWGISKIQATPSWNLITGAICYASFGLLYILADKYSKKDWARPMAPAGRSTLTMYLVPYLVYPLAMLSGLGLPEFFATGWPGILKCFLFAVLVTLFTRGLEIVKLRLRI